METALVMVEVSDTIRGSRDIDIGSKFEHNELNFGLLNGIGSYRHFKNILSPGVLFLVVEVPVSDIAETQDASYCYFKSGIVKFRGSLAGAANYIAVNSNVDKNKIVGLHQTIKDKFTVGVTDFTLVDAGHNCCIQSGEYSHITAKTYANIKSGNFSVATASRFSVVESGLFGTSITCDAGKSISGDNGVSFSGYKGTSITGKNGIAIVDQGSVSGDIGSVITIKNSNGTDFSAKIGENGFLPNILYVLDNNKLVPKEK